MIIILKLRHKGNKTNDEEEKKSKEIAEELEDLFEEEYEYDDD